MVSFSLTVTDPDFFDAGYLYSLGYVTQVDGVVTVGDVFTNRATIYEYGDVDAEYTVESEGGGDGDGTNSTFFTLKKVLSGDASEDASNAVFTVEYTIKGSADPARRLEVRVDQEVRSARVPLGSTFVVKEVDLPEIDGVVGGDWTISGDGVVPGADGTYEVTPGSNAGVYLTLTNTVVVVPAPPSGELSWNKVDPDGQLLSGSEWALAGPEGSTAVIDNGSGDADPAEGSLRVVGLAWGEYTLEETTAPEGFELSSEVWVSSIGEGTPHATFGDIENVLIVPDPEPEPDPDPEVTPVPGVDPAPDPETVPVSTVKPESPALASTGASTVPLAVLASVLLGCGVIVLAAARRRSGADRSVTR